MSEHFARPDAFQAKAATALDLLLGGTAVSTPLWLQNVEVVAQAVVAIGGAILITIRVAIAIRQYLRGRS